jgi:hypothetical protein
MYQNQHSPRTGMLALDMIKNRLPPGCSDTNFFDKTAESKMALDAKLNSQGYVTDGFSFRTNSNDFGVKVCNAKFDAEFEYIKQIARKFAQKKF